MKFLPLCIGMMLLPCGQNDLIAEPSDGLINKVTQLEKRIAELEEALNTHSAKPDWANFEKQVGPEFEVVWMPIISNRDIEGVLEQEPGDELEIVGAFQAKIVGNRIVKHGKYFHNPRRLYHKYYKVIGFYNENARHGYWKFYKYTSSIRSWNLHKETWYINGLEVIQREWDEFNSK